MVKTYNLSALVSASCDSFRLIEISLISVQSPFSVIPMSLLSSSCSCRLGVSPCASSYIDSRNSSRSSSSGISTSTELSRKNGPSSTFRSSPKVTLEWLWSVVSWRPMLICHILILIPSDHLSLLFSLFKILNLSWITQLGRSTHPWLCGWRRRQKNASSAITALTNSSVVGLHNNIWSTMQNKLRFGRKGSVGANDSWCEEEFHSDVHSNLC